MRSWLTLLVAVCIGLAAACAEKAEAPEESLAPTTTGSSTASSGPSLGTIDIPYPPTGLETATVTRVVDGDTIHVSTSLGDFTVRYIGIDTPETVDPSRPSGCFGQESSARNKKMVEGKAVELEKDVSETDEFGRLLRYVWVDRQMVNAILVRDGFAQAATYPPDVKYQARLLELQTEARTARRGLWDICADATPVASNAQTPPPGAGTETCDFSGTNQAVIKGNISSSGEKIYHVPGQDSYDETGITEERGERWFCTEQEAVGAGWRKPRS